MRLNRFRSRFLALTLGFGLVFSGLVALDNPQPAFAAADLTLPAGQQTMSTNFQDLCASSCVLSGFGYTDQIRLVVTSASGAGLAGKVKLATGTSTTGLTAVTGYNGGTLAGLTADTNSEIAFVGTQDAINAVLPKLQYKGSTAGLTESISISATLAGVGGRTLHYFPGTGHYYEFVAANVDWDAAKTAAEGLSFNGMTGYLATILTEDENNFIMDKVTSPDLWMGAKFTPADASDPSSDGTAGSWEWVTGPTADRVKFWDGTRYGSAVTGRYANWNSKQPDGSSDCAATNWSGAGKWDDLACENPGDYLVEYGGLPGQSPTLELTKTISVVVPLACGPLTAFDTSDFELRGDASLSGSSITLTPDSTTKAGAVWSMGRVNLSSDFCVAAEVYLGDRDAGADGLALVLQSVNSRSLTSGGGLGYASINPSFAIEIDTYYNGGTQGDPSSGADHIALMKDGDTATHNAWGAEPVELSNVEDGRWRLITLEWDATAKTVTVGLDGTPRFTAVSADLLSYFSSSNGSAFWGFTGATGGSTNEQAVRNIQYSALQRTNTAPSFVSGPANRTVLVDSENEIAVTLSDDSTQKDQWDTDVSVSNAAIFAATPTFTITGQNAGLLSFDAHPTAVGSSSITLTITDADGVTATHTFTVTVATTLPQSATTNQNPVTPTVIPVQPPLTPRLFPVAPQITPQNGPVFQNNQIPTPPNAPTSNINGVPTPVSTLVTDPTTLNIRTGLLNIGMNVPQGQGQIQQGPGGSTELQMQKGGKTTLQGGGLAPGSFVQVFLPSANNQSRELARIPVDSTGSFSGDVLFGGASGDAPMPVGRNVMQMVTVDERGRQAVVEMTVNVAQSAPTPEFNRSNQTLPNLTPGASIATRAGLPIPVTVRALLDQGQAVIEGEGWTMSVGIGSQGGLAESEGGASITFERNQEAVISGGGFMPGTRADIWLFSDPTLLGTVEVDDQGNFSGTVVIDQNMIPTGEHTLQMQGVGTDGYVVAANVGVLVADPVTEAQSTTQASTGLLWWIWVLAALLLAVAAIVGVVQLRKTRAN